MCEKSFHSHGGGRWTTCSPGSTGQRQTAQYVSESRRRSDQRAVSEQRELPDRPVQPRSGRIERSTRGSDSLERRLVGHLALDCACCLSAEPRFHVPIEWP